MVWGAPPKEPLRLKPLQDPKKKMTESGISGIVANNEMMQEPSRDAHLAALKAQLGEGCLLLASASRCLLSLGPPIQELLQTKVLIPTSADCSVSINSNFLLFALLNLL